MSGGVGGVCRKGLKEQAEFRREVGQARQIQADTLEAQGWEPPTAEIAWRAESAYRRQVELEAKRAAHHAHAQSGQDADPEGWR
eukprot:gene37764-49466_t